MRPTSLDPNLSTRGKKLDSKTVDRRDKNEFILFQYNRLLEVRQVKDKLLRRYSQGTSEVQDPVALRGTESYKGLKWAIAEQSSRRSDVKLTNSASPHPVSTQ